MKTKVQLLGVNRIDTRHLTRQLNQEKAQLSSLSPFAPQNYIGHTVREWEVQWVTSPEDKPDLDGATLVLALLVLKTAGFCGMFVVQMPQRSVHACAL